MRCRATDDNGRGEWRKLTKKKPKGERERPENNGIQQRQERKKKQVKVRARTTPVLGEPQLRPLRKLSKNAPDFTVKRRVFYQASTANMLNTSKRAALQRRREEDDDRTVPENSVSIRCVVRFQMKRDKVETVSQAGGGCTPPTTIIGNEKRQIKTTNKETIGRKTYWGKEGNARKNNKRKEWTTDGGGRVSL